MKKNRPSLHFYQDHNQNLDSPIFPAIRPWDPLRFQPEVEIVVHYQNTPYSIAKLISFCRVPSLHKIPDIGFLWTSGQPDPETERQRYIRYYQTQLSLETTPFALYIFHRIQYL